MNKLKTGILSILFLFTSLAYAHGEEIVLIGGSEILYILLIFLLPKKPSMKNKVSLFYIMSCLFYFFSNFTLETTETNFIKF